MVVSFSFFISFIILLYTWIKFKDVASPPLILAGVWFVMYLILMLNYKDIDNTNFYYSSFVIGLICFIIGFSLMTYNKDIKSKFKSEKKRSNLVFNSVVMKLILMLEIVLTLIYIHNMRSLFSRFFVDNFWHTLSYAKSTGNFTEGIITEYSRNFTIALSIVSSIVYFTNSNKLNREYFLFTTAIALFFSITAGNRGIIFMLIIAITIANIYVNNYSSKKVFLIFAITIMLVMVIFIKMAFMKYTSLKDMPIFEFIALQFKVYFSTSLIAFVQWISTSPLYEYGRNTFRFIFAVLSKLGYDVNVADTVQEFTQVGDNYTNVYTVLHYYAKDFGLIYAFIIEYILGIIYGKLYNNSALTKKINLFSIAMISILYFPLVGQFFDDMYFSRLSTWIQYIFWFGLFCKTPFLIRERKENSE